MGRLLLVCRLATRDLTRRRTEAALLLLAIMATTTTLTLGLAMRAAATDPYQSTRQATNGPDVVASAAPAEVSSVERLSSAPGVIGHSGPYPVTRAEMRASGRVADVQAMGRGGAPAAVDQPELIHGAWVGAGGVVIEAAFADALDVRVGDPITLDGRAFDVVGIAVTAAMPPYPQASCIVPPGCMSGASPEDVADPDVPAGLLRNPGLVWLTESDVSSLVAHPDSLVYMMNLTLADPDSAPDFVEAHQSSNVGAPRIESWKDIRDQATEHAGDAQILLGIGAWLLGLLAVASISVLVGGRMADQTRRVGLLKAVGGTPSLVAAVLLAEHVLVAIVAAAAGLAIGSLAVPWLSEASAGFIGSAGTPPITVSTIGIVTGVALGVAVLASFIPAIRAARTSTVRALAGAARPPRRTGSLIAISARLPVPLLLGLRLAARRPRRVVLAVVSIAITVSGIYVALVLNTYLTTRRLVGGLDDPQTEPLRQVLFVVMVMVLALAAVNAVFITWATVLDSRHSSALTRALGATPHDVSVAVAAAQVLPALVGALVGVFPGGNGLFVAINAITGGDSGRATLPPLWQLIAVVMATALVVTALSIIPARLGSRGPVAEALQAELA